MLLLLLGYAVIFLEKRITYICWFCFW